MAGHSKWANIQHRKNAQDRQRGKVFTKLIRELTTAARAGSDPASNARLRLAIDRARAGNMPGDTIDRAVRRGAGELDGVVYEQIIYEAYGPGGVALLVEALTDNRNRTVAEVRHMLTRHGGNLGADGSVAYLFNHVGLLVFPPGTDEDALMAVAIEAGAEDVIANDDRSLEVLTAPGDLASVREALGGAGFSAALDEVIWRAEIRPVLEGEAAAQVARLVAALEDLDDVQQVHCNADLPAGDDTP